MDAASLRAAIARAWLGADECAGSVGAVVLRPHQRSAVARLRRTLAEFGGALLADDVGLGKTYVAAAVAREAARPLVVAPAALRAMWTDALRAARVDADIASYEGLSRGHPVRGAPDLLVLDEAHHARTPGTRRYRRLAELATGARVLLVSATPVHNSRRDLLALLALFLGVRARALDDASLARCVVRREHDDVGAQGVPAATAPEPLIVGDDEAVLRAIMELPPPVPPRDGADGGALVAWSLARQWASSRGALAGALRRRLARAGALAAALECGRHPSRAELAAWEYSDDAVQLAFPELLSEPAPATDALLAAVRAHERGVRSLLTALGRTDDRDAARADRLRELRARHPGEKIIAFTQYADTAAALYRHLRAAPGVAALTARGGLVTGGALARREVLHRFAPEASGRAPPSAAERIDLLITTDLLSEGLNLQDASVVVHLDLPWTPARLEQRVGRSRRLGARHACTAVYVMSPPASAEALLRLERRLRDKLRAAGRAVGVAGAILPALEVEPSATRCAQLLRSALAAWANAPAAPLDAEPSVLPAAAVRAPRDGVVALVREGERVGLVGAISGPVTEDPAVLLELVRGAGGPDAELDAARLAHARAAVDRWRLRRAAECAAGGAITRALRAPGDDTRRRALRRIAAVTARASHHRRAVLGELAAQARRAVAGAYGAGAERVLGELAAASMPDEAWLRAVCAFGSANARESDEESAAPETVALLVLVR